MKSIHAFLSALVLSLFGSQMALAGEWGITDVRGTSEYVRGAVWSGKFQSYNGAEYDASAFYKQKNTTITMQQTAYVELEELVIFSPVFFDNGYESDLFTSEPIMAFGLGFQKKVGNTTLELVGNNLLQIGGETSERPCVDGFKRQYHCGLGVAWSDASSALLKHDLMPTFNFVLRYAF